MDISIPARMRLREIDQECQARLARLEAMIREAERLRAEISQAEQEISEVWESELPRPNKLLLAQVLRSQCHLLESTLRRLQAEVATDAPPRRLSYRKRRE